MHSLQVKKFGSLPAVRTTWYIVWKLNCPKHHRSGRHGFLSGRQSAHSIIRPDDVDSRPDLPLCWEASNYSSLHPFGRFNSPFERPSVFDQLQDFFPKHRYGKIVATVRTTWIPVQTTWIPVRTRSSIRQVSQFKSRCLIASQHGPDARTSNMEIGCINSTVWMTILLVWMHEASVWKLLAADMRPSGRSCQIGRIFSEIFRILIT